MLPCFSHELIMTMSVTERLVALLGPRVPRYWPAVWSILIGGSFSFNTFEVPP